MAEEHENHGHSVAAWSMVGLLIVASLLIALGVGFGQTWLDIAGVVLAVIAIVVGKGLSAAGFGAPALKAPGEQDTRDLPTQAQTGVH